MSPDESAFLVSEHDLACQQEVSLALNKTLSIHYEGHSVNSEIRFVIAVAYLLAESWCCLYKAPTFISHNTKETIS